MAASPAGCFFCGRNRQTMPVPRRASHLPPVGDRSVDWARTRKTAYAGGGKTIFFAHYTFLPAWHIRPSARSRHAARAPRTCIPSSRAHCQRCTCTHCASNWRTPRAGFDRSPGATFSHFTRWTYRARRLNAGRGTRRTLLHTARFLLHAACDAVVELWHIFFCAFCEYLNMGMVCVRICVFLRTGSDGNHVLLPGGHLVFFSLHTLCSWHGTPCCGERGGKCCFSTHVYSLSRLSRIMEEEHTCTPSCRRCCLWAVLVDSICLLCLY